MNSLQDNKCISSKKVNSLQDNKVISPKKVNSLTKLYKNDLITIIYNDSIILCNIFDFNTLEEYFTTITKINDVILNEAMIPFLLKCFDVNVKSHKISIQMSDCGKKKKILIDAMIESYLPVKKDFVVEKIENNFYDKINLFKVNSLLKNNINGNHSETDQFPRCYENTLLPDTVKLHFDIEQMSQMSQIPQLFTRENIDIEIKDGYQKY